MRKIPYKLSAVMKVQNSFQVISRHEDAGFLTSYVRKGSLQVIGRNEWARYLAGYQP